MAIKVIEWGADWSITEVDSTDEKKRNIVQALQRIIPFVQTLCCVVIELVDKLRKPTNRRVAHLAVHGKKWRTRKKNRNRLINALRRK